MRERGHQDLLMTVDDPELEGKLLAALEKLSARGSDCDRHCANGSEEFESDGAHGCVFEEEVQRRYPEFETRGGVELGGLFAADEQGSAGVGDGLQLGGSRSVIKSCEAR